jgi:hypothetical protein
LIWREYSNNTALSCSGFVSNILKGGHFSGKREPFTCEREEEHLKLKSAPARAHEQIMDEILIQIIKDESAAGKQASKQARKTYTL